MQINNNSAGEDLPVDIEYLYRHSPVGHILFALDGTILHTNDTFLEWMEAGGDARLKEKKFVQLLSVAGRLYHQMVLHPLLSMQKSVQEINLDIVTLKGNRFSCLFNAKVIEHGEGGEKLVLASIMKIDDRKKYEAQLLREKESADRIKNKLEFLANNIPVLSFTLSPDGIVDFIYDRACDYLQIKREEYAKGAVFSYIHPDELVEAKALWNESMVNKILFEKEFRLRNRNYVYEWFLGRVVPYKNEAGEVVLWFGTFTNINEQKERQKNILDNLHNNLLNAKETITKNEENLKQIAWEQSHIVRLPLANMLGIIHLLEFTSMNEEVKELVDMLKECADQLDTVIRSIVNKTYEAKEMNTDMFVI